MKGNDVKILAVDDQEGICRLIKRILSEEGYSVKTATSPRRALTLATSEHFDIVITDIRMQEMDGISLLRQILLAKPEQAVVIITAYGSIESAVEAVRAGAFDYITKPFQSEELLHSIRRVTETLDLRSENAKLRMELDTIQNLNSGVIGKSAALMSALAFAGKLADSGLSILITGETGTGKEVIAKFIHQQSGRRQHPFIPVQCGLIPESLMESELFGHRKGAFTGAIADKKGLLEEAENGTVFLDEIGDISADIQAKLLRFLQEKEIRKVGDSRSRKLDVRMISATNKDLQSLVEAKSFRDDLYYRLKTVEINLPPLRKRKEDIPLLIEHFLEGYNTTHQRMVKIDPECYRYLLSYDWPGNIRELRNMTETAATICSHGRIRLSDISYILQIGSSRPVEEDLTFSEMKKKVIREFEQNYASRLLRRNRGNISSAAREAGMDKKNFWEMMKKHAITADQYKE